MGENIGADAAKLAGLLADLMHKIRARKITLQNLEWFNMLSEAERHQLSGNSIEDDRFHLIKTCEFMVSADFNHDACLRDFQKKFKKEFYHFNPEITDNHFGNVSARLVPGQKLEARFYQIKQIKERVSSNECLAFLMAVPKIILPGAQGLAELWKHIKDKEILPRGRWCLSFDEKDKLWQDADGYHRVPGIYRISAGDWYFGLDYFENDWGSDYCLVCFRDLSN